MKKSTINRILLGVIAFLVIAICILSVQIVRRPHYINLSEPETTVIEEAVANATPAWSGNEEQTSEEASPEDSSPLRGKTSTKVNIRDAASTDAKVLETVEANYEFDIIEIQDNGWTKIKYEDGAAYISSSYVIIIQS